MNETDTVFALRRQRAGERALERAVHEGDSYRRAIDHRDEIAGRIATLDCAGLPHPGLDVALALADFAVAFFAPLDVQP